jgi:small-conductance mechanosensitive channel
LASLSALRGFAVAGAFALLCTPSSAAAQAETGLETPADPSAQIAVERESLQREMKGLRANLAGRSAPAEVLDEREADLHTLERIDGLYLRWQEQIDRRADRERRHGELEARIAAGFEAAVGEPPPYTLTRVDALAAGRDGATAREAELEEIARRAGESHDRAREDLAEKERIRRELDATQPEAEDPLAAEARSRVLARMLLEIRLAKTRFQFAEAESANTEAELELQHLQAKFRDETLAWARAGLRFDEDDLQQALAALEERELEAREALDRAKVGLESAERGLVGAQAELDDSDAGDAAKLEARRLARQGAQRRVAQADAELARLPTLRELTENRHALLAGELSRSDVSEWHDRAQTFVAELDRNEQLAVGRIADLSDRAAATLTLAEAAAAPREARWLGRQGAELQKLIALYRADLTGLKESRLLAQRAAADLAQTVDFSIVDLIDSARNSLVSSWEQELVVVDDRSVTTGKVVTAVVLFVLGYIASRFASRLLRRLLARGFSMDAGAALAFQGLSFYLLLTLFFLLSLRTVGIPLTAFTVLGGGIAIGVGFGSQNIVNNFISGLILMVERPIKVGDIVEVDETYGHIEQIGARSTRVRTFDNIHIIVPNSAFLEQNVVNWTLSDNLVRTYVDVGVAYGSNTREVDRLIQRALADHGKVMDDPEPVVLFTEFGDNALGFRAYFWLRMRLMMDRRRVESDVRHRIDRLFRDAGITIAFPQRDVHLDTLQPLEIRLAAADEGESKPS